MVPGLSWNVLLACLYFWQNAAHIRLGTWLSLLTIALLVGGTRLGHRWGSVNIYELREEGKKENKGRRMIGHKLLCFVNM